LTAVLGLWGAGPGWGFEWEVAAQARDLARGLEAAEVGSVAVVDFTDLRGRETELGRFLAEEISAALVSVESELKVVDRSRLAAIMEEWELSATGLVAPVDPETEEIARKVGRIAGVEALVTGRLTPFRDTVHVSLLVLEVGSAEIVGGAQLRVPKTEAIAELESRSLTVECDPGVDSERGEISIEGAVLLDRVVKEDYELSLYGCTRVEGAVQCAVVVRNRGRERNLLLSGKTRAVYEEGGRTHASRMSLGRQWATGELSRVGSRMLEGVPTSLGVVFEAVPEGVGAFRFLDLDFYGLEVRFRDVPVER
jgi:hypothetical protein